MAGRKYRGYNAEHWSLARQMFWKVEEEFLRGLLLHPIWDHMAVTCALTPLPPALSNARNLGQVHYLCFLCARKVG